MGFFKHDDMHPDIPPWQSRESFALIAEYQAVSR